MNQEKSNYESAAGHSIDLYKAPGGYVLHNLNNGRLTVQMGENEDSVCSAQDLESALSLIGYVA